MPYTFARSEELFRRAQQSIAGGVNSGIRKLEAPVPLYFARGSGPNLWDVDGNHYIDFQLGWRKISKKKCVLHVFAPLVKWIRSVNVPFP